MIKRMLQIALVTFVVLFSSSSVFALGIGFFGNGGGGYAWWGGYGSSHYHGGGGFIMDTNLAYDRVFNYRLEFGVNYMDISTPGNTVLVFMNHYFGFGIVRSKVVRFWLGPVISVGGLVTNVTGAVGGMGLAFGLNFNFGQVFTLSFTAAGRFIGGIANSNGGYGGDGYGSVAFMFRVNQDVYSGGRY